MNLDFVPVCVWVYGGHAVSQSSGLCSFSRDRESSEEKKQITIARVLANLCKDETGRFSQKQRRKLPAQRDNPSGMGTQN